MATYKLRDEIYATRLPMTKHELRVYDWKDRWNRWQGVDEAYRCLDIETIEAESVWGKNVVDRINDFLYLVDNLHMAILKEYAADNNPALNQAIAEADHEKFRSMIYWRIDGDEEKDEFANNLKAKVACIEEFMRPYLTN